MIQQHRYAPRVEANLVAGLKRGIRGSSVIFVNGNRIDGVPNLDKLVEYVESGLAGRDKSQAKKTLVQAEADANHLRVRGFFPSEVLFRIQY